MEYGILTLLPILVVVVLAGGGLPEAALFPGRRTEHSVHQSLSDRLAGAVFFHQGHRFVDCSMMKELVNGKIMKFANINLNQLVIIL